MHITTVIKIRPKKQKHKKIPSHNHFHLDHEENQKTLNAKKYLDQIGTSFDQPIQYHPKSLLLNSWLKGNHIQLNSKNENQTQIIGQKSNLQFSNAHYVQQKEIKAKQFKKLNKISPFSKFPNQFNKQNVNFHQIVTNKFSSLLKSGSDNQQKQNQKRVKNDSNTYSTKHRLRNCVSIMDINGQIIKETNINKDMTEKKNAKSTIKIINPKQRLSQLKRKIYKSQTSKSRLKIRSSKGNRTICYTQTPLTRQFKKINQYLKKEGFKNITIRRHSQTKKYSQVL